MAKGRSVLTQTVRRKYNNYIVYDFETGGFDTKTNPVTEIAAIVLDGKTLEEIIRYDNLVKPYDDNLVYDPKATAITGITKEMCEKDGITMKQLSSDIVELYKLAGGGGDRKGAGYFPILVAHNAGFDNKFTQQVAEYAKIELDKYLFGTKDHYGNFQPLCIDTVLMCRQAWRSHDPGPIDNKLHTACQYANIDIIDAHRAMNDVEALSQLFIHLLSTSKKGNEGAVASTSGKYRETFQM